MAKRKKAPKGRWDIDGNRIVSHGAGTIAVVPPVQDGGVFEWMKNRNLLAASPEMFAELEATRDWLASFSMPPTATIVEKGERLAAIDAVLRLARGPA